MRVPVVVIACVLAWCAAARAEPNPKRKVVVLEYRASSSALTGIGARVATAIGKQTSLEVLGPDQMRSIYGEHLEQAVVKCAGEAECIAKIGAKVGAVEVILVGISELGDVILTMQRIDVAAKTVNGRIADSLATGATPNDDQLGYYLAKLLPPGDFLRFGVIDIVSTQADSLVTVNGEKRGTTPIKGMRLHAPAEYVIRVEKTGFTPFTTKVELPADGEIKVGAELSRRGAATAWYAHWYVLAIGGAIVAGAAGTTIYFATRQTSSVVPVTGSF